MSIQQPHPKTSKRSLSPGHLDRLRKLRARDGRDATATALGISKTTLDAVLGGGALLTKTAVRIESAIDGAGFDVDLTRQDLEDDGTGGRAA